MKSVTINALNIDMSPVEFGPQLTNLASKFTCDILIKTISENEVINSVDLKSILGVMSIYYGNKKSFIIEANGSDENDAIEKIGDFFNDIVLKHRKGE